MKRCALDKLSVEIQSNACTGIMGPNGAGKSTFTRLIYGRTDRDSGTLNVLGLDPRYHSCELRSQIGVVTQDNFLDEDLDSLSNLEVFGTYHGMSSREARKRASECLSMFNLSDRFKNSISSLSGGLQRRLALARAMMHDLTLILLDEPTTGLDPVARTDLWEILEKMTERGRTIVLSTHYLEEAERLCDSIVLIDHGRVLDQGSPLELIEPHVGSDVPISANGSDHSRRRATWTTYTSRFSGTGKRRTRVPVIMISDQTTRPDRILILRSLTDATRIFRRELMVWRQDWFRHILFAVVRGAVTVIAFGLLLGKYVVLPDGGRYIDFIAPALVVATCLQTVSLDGLYATRTNLYDRRLFESMLTAPVGASEIILGELYWHAFRAALQGTVLAILFVIFGAQASWSIALIPLLLAVCGPCFSAPAMLWASLSPRFTNLLYFNTLVVAPVYFLSGVFFPVDAFPAVLQPLIQLSPIYQATVVSRGIFYGSASLGTLGHLAIFLAMTAIAMALTIRRFVRQLSI